jgi:hypothetical protein
MLDPHWLKEKYKNESTEYLETLLFDLDTFGGNEMDKKQIRAELERRESEKGEGTCMPKQSN